MVDSNTPLALINPSSTNDEHNSNTRSVTDLGCRKTHYSSCTKPTHIEIECQETEHSGSLLAINTNDVIQDNVGVQSCADVDSVLSARTNQSSEASRDIADILKDHSEVEKVLHGGVDTASLIESSIK